MKELWVEKYRPSTIADYVFTDATLKQQVENWVRVNNTDANTWTNINDGQLVVWTKVDNSFP
jgi:hypothetical protein